jgi:4-aminobutyrate aminotransferase-like enzyme
VLSVLKREHLQENALATGGYLRSGLEALAKRHAIFGAVRGHGLLLGLDVQGEDKALAKRRTGDLVNALASTHRVLIGSEGPHGSILKLRPPMPFYRDHAEQLLQAIDAAAGTIA